MVQKRVLIIVADGFEEIEAVSPIDILRGANIDVTVAGLTSRQTTGAHGIILIADTTLDDCDGNFDAVILPGGSPGAQNLSKSEKVKTRILTMHRAGKIVAAICASPVTVLAPLGILKGKKATCYEGMEKDFPQDVTFVNEPVVTDGTIVTSRGPGTAQFFGLKLVALLTDEAAAALTKKRMLLSER